MVLRFNIENEPNLPDGGPVTFTVTGRRSVDIGRDRHLDWTLPDPARTISGKHCEVHFRDGGYWLHDVSTNGTFLNGADQRMRGRTACATAIGSRSATTSSEFRWRMRLAGVSQIKRRNCTNPRSSSMRITESFGRPIVTFRRRSIRNC